MINKISIVVPVYNAEAYIEACVESVIAQTYRNWELILVDDSSTDRSLQRCNQYLLDERIHMLHIPHLGVSNARNAGVSAASGNYIMFVDSDDTITEDACEYLMNHIGESDICITGYETVYSNRVVARKPSSYIGKIENMEDDLEEYLQLSILQGPCFKLFRKDIIQNNSILFPVSLDYGEDAFFVYEYLKYIHKITVCNYVTYRYYVRGKSLSHGFRKKKYSINIMLNQKICELCKQWEFEYDERLQRLNRNSFASYLNDSINADSKKEMYESIKDAILMEETQSAYQTAENISLQKRVIAFFVKRNCVIPLMLLSYFNVLKYKRKSNR